MKDLVKMALEIRGELLRSEESWEHETLEFVVERSLFFKMYALCNEIVAPEPKALA